MKENRSHFSIPSNFPIDGLSRWKQLAPFMPISKETFRKMVKAGRAPQPLQLSQRCTCYSNKEMHQFFQDVLNYKYEMPIALEHDVNIGEITTIKEI